MQVASKAPNNNDQTSEQTYNNEDALKLVKLHLKLDKIESNQKKWENEIDESEALIGNLTYQATMDLNSQNHRIQILNELNEYEKLFTNSFSSNN
ncbi:hypothetical protein GPJ56_005916 [Histomonas meleagridis]|uniref:uncharacterized protein n=1 Tax=Histomonas meleagridis TaxID=135588 RepID=UPI00355ACC49|nr:hypothetical protein GPJ56_005916 [Histomonas meleagridis]KAH0801932.1 hypothetical protein GO595_005350 [Histomonas meleagridis]